MGAEGEARLESRRGRRKRLVDAVEDGLPPTYTGVVMETVDLGPAGHLQSEGTKNPEWSQPTE